jgi:hypothetical protein
MRGNEIAVLDAAIVAVARFVAARNGLDAETREGFGWVPVAAAIAVSHPAVRGLKVPAPMGRKEVSFADRYVSMALKDGVAMSALSSAVKGNLGGLGIVRKLLTAREFMATETIVLPAKEADLVAAVRAALAKASGPAEDDSAAA